MGVSLLPGKPAVSASRSSSPSIAGVLRPRRVFAEGLLISSLAAASGVGPSINAMAAVAARTVWMPEKHPPPNRPIDLTHRFPAL
jgi:hypothetical protein